MRYLILITLICMSCTWIRKHPDSMVEEFVEELIDDATGLDIDFTSTDSEK